MPTVDTALSPTEILNRMHERVRSLYGKSLNARPGDAKADELMLADVEAIDAFVDKLNYAFIKKVKNDAYIDVNSSEKLKEIKKIATEMRIGKRTALREEHFTYKTWRRLEKIISKMLKKTRRKGAKELKKVQKEKESLAKKEKVAKEKMGRK